MILPSVTQIIGFCNRDAFAGVPEILMERAQARGISVHSEVAMTLEGVWFDADPAMAGYLKSLTDWKNEYVVQVIAVEPELVAPKLGFQGHPDAILRLRGDEGLSLVDWKTPKPLSLSWRIQLAGYKILCEHNGYRIARVASLRLDAKGGPAKFTGYTKTLAYDTNVFLAGLLWWKFFNA